jgi:hypothetical protein
LTVEATVIELPVASVIVQNTVPFQKPPEVLSAEPWMLAPEPSGLTNFAVPLPPVDVVVSHQMYE